mmetsp:Transcript_36396/g.36017  ORF Transcript_36396/g.36017 Transcript_36396/m.36017 type:complete len:99 (+) Transcript_36396:87-383(+)
MIRSMKKVNDSNPASNNLDSCQILWYSHPNGTSFKAVRHWSQIIKSGRFEKFDYGKEKNLKIYGKEEPPLYNLSKVQESNIPIALLTGKNDMLASPED